MQRVINFSAGKSSGKMTIDNYREGDIVIFCDTGREHQKTYKFLNDFEAHENIPIVRLKREGGFEGFLTNWGNGSYGKKIPNRMYRECTLELKVRTARRYLRSLGIMEYENLIGFRYDERERVKKHKEKWKKVTTVFPLYDDGVTKEMVNDYWAKKPYTLEIPHILGNCTLCFMKGKDAIIRILQDNPELADPWIADEEAAKEFYSHTYIPGFSIKQLLEIAKRPTLKQMDLFDVKPAFNCACTS